MSKKKNKKNVKKTEKEIKVKISKRLIVFYVMVFIVFTLLLGRIAWIEFIDGPRF